MDIFRHAVVAGLFYPASPQLLVTDIESYLNTVATSDILPRPKVLIVPHAGYIYSGAIAATAFAQLIKIKHEIKRIIIIGPSHHVSFNGLALSRADYFTTPLGAVAIDKNAQNKLLDMDGINFLDEAHAKEHSIEVQLPFLQVIVDHFEIVPIVTGYVSPELISSVLDILWDSSETIFIISTDLSHYHDYETAKQLDAITAKAILNLDSNTLNQQHACGYSGLRGLLYYTQHHPMNRYILDVRNSGDTAGDKNRVVGYGSFLFAEEE